MAKIIDVTNKTFERREKCISEMATLKTQVSFPGRAGARQVHSLRHCGWAMKPQQLSCVTELFELRAQTIQYK